MPLLAEPQDPGLIALPLWLDLSAVVAGALAGAMFATRRGVSITGVLLIAVLTGFGGGLVRDILLQRGTPIALVSPVYVPTVAVAAVVGLLFGQYVVRLNPLLLTLDGLALGLFTVLGVEKALIVGLPVGAAVLVGVAAASAGGIIRDLMVGDPPEMMRAGPWEASAALAGALTYALLYVGFGLPRAWVEWSVVLGVMLLRIVSVQRGWQAPMATDVAPALDRRLAMARRRLARRQSREQQG